MPIALICMSLVVQLSKLWAMVKSVGEIQNYLGILNDENLDQVEYQ